MKMNITCLLFIWLLQLFHAALSLELNCPDDWHQYENSCYKNYPAASYQKAMDKCFWLLTKQQYIKRPYLANIESHDEMQYLNTMMKENGIKEIYIGANNIIKRTNVLSWERLDIADEVDKNLLCPNVYVDDSSFFCGYIENMLFDQANVPPHLMNKRSSDPQPDPNFCVNVSDCFVSLPYICEVNCTNQEEKCLRWTQESVTNLKTKTTPTTTSTTTTTTTSTTTSTSSTSTTSTTTSTTTTSTTTTSTTTTSTTTTTTPYNPCLNHECLNNATCVYDLRSHLNYTCNCIIGFEGTFCQKDERPCQQHRNRCTHNSTCNQFYNSKYYNCTCPTGFEGFHCEINIDDCIEDVCKNGGQCEDLINDFRCQCTSYFSGEFCEIKNKELEMKENVSRSFSVLAILFIILTLGFFIALDALKFIFKIEPESLSQERNLRKKQKLMKKIIEDMKDKKKRRQYRKLIHSAYNAKDPFIMKIEKTFDITYDLDLVYIDEDVDSKRLDISA